MLLSAENVSRETLDKLKIYEALLKKWQKTINIVSNSTIAHAWERHIVDSAQLVGYIPDNVKLVYDIGSGGGFPGLVIAIMRPDLTVHCIESDARKCSFLRAVVRETGIDAHIHAERIESAATHLPKPDLITARALASLDKLIDLVGSWVLCDSGARMLLLKGRSAMEEVAAAKKQYSFNTQDVVSETNAEARMLLLSDICHLNDR